MSQYFKEWVIDMGSLALALTETHLSEQESLEW